MRTSNCNKLISASATFILATILSAAQPEASPKAVVHEFYTYHFSHDMGFTSGGVQERNRWLTSELLQACRAYFDLPQNPNEAPFINGDPFTGTQEYPQSFSIGSVKMSKTTARVLVQFHWKETSSRKATAVLRKMNGKWLIDDIEFQDQESLRKTLAESLPAK